MNRAFLIIFIPAALVAAAYFAVAAYLGVPLRAGPFIGGGIGFAAAVLIVVWYRRKSRRAGD